MRVQVLRLLIADNNVELCDVLSRFFSRQADVEVVGVAYDGEQALSLIREHEPDVVILDITMPLLDGLAVLERLPELNLGHRPHIIVLTAFGREDLMTKMTQLGADYYIVKPFDLEVLATRVRQFSGIEEPMVREGGVESAPTTSTSVAAERHAASGYKGRDLVGMVTDTIHQMGVPAHFKGYNYLRDAVLLVLQEETMLGGNLTKVLYPRIAGKYGTSTGGVEAAIRNAIITAWQNGNPEYISTIVGKSAISTKGRFPSNSLMIAKIADRLRVSLRTG